jgi:hypothetical protein
MTSTFRLMRWLLENRLMLVLVGLVFLLLLGRLFGSRDIPEDPTSAPPAPGDDDADDESNGHGGGDVA